MVSPPASQQDGAGFGSMIRRGLSVWSLLLLPMSARFHLGALVSLTSKNMCVSFAHSGGTPSHSARDQCSY